jgi:RHS repeat-associated protein
VDEAVLQYQYDLAGNVTQLTDPRGNVTQFSYDPMNRVTQVTLPDPDGGGGLTSPLTRYGYDLDGNLVSVTDARNNVTLYQYDALNRLVQVTLPDPDGSGALVAPVIRYGYDFVGNVTAVTDPLNRVTQYRYDARNRLIQVIDPLNQSTSYGYDLDDNLIRVTDGLSNQTQFSYDARNRLITEIDPLSQIRQYAYDFANNLISRTDRNGRQLQFGYDNLNRIMTETWIGTTPAQVIRYSYDAMSNLRTISDLYSSLTYSYDNRDRIKTIDNTGTPNIPAVILTHTYDPTGNRLSLTDTLNSQPKGSEAYLYDPLNRLTQITQSGTGVINKRIDLTYNPTSQLSQLNRYSDLTASQQIALSTYSYDNQNRLTQLAHAKGATALATHNWVYDAASRITQMTSSDGTSSYGYDNTDQLTAATQTFQPNEVYSYDATGNRTNTGYQTSPNNRLQSDGIYTYSYDNEGNRIKRTKTANKEVTEYVWDYRNRLTQVLTKSAAGRITKRADYTYDAFNRRISKTVDPDGVGAKPATIERFVYDRDHIKLVFNGSGTQTHRYLHGAQIDQVLAEESAGQVRWMLSDHQGTVRDVTNNSGVIQKHLRYDSFGTITSQTSPTITTRFNYTGRELDAETGLYFYRARYYDPSVGRFLSEDPIGFGGQDANLYRYVGNSPIKLADPMGLMPVAAPPKAPPPPAPPPTIPPEVGAAAGRAGTAASGWALVWGLLLSIPVILGTQQGLSDGTVTGCAERCKKKKNKIKAKCKARFTEDQNPPAHCPDFVYGEGATRGEAQENAKLTAPPECRKFYGHCDFFGSKR